MKPSKVASKHPYQSENNLNHIDSIILISPTTLRILINLPKPSHDQFLIDFLLSENFLRQVSTSVITRDATAN